MKKITILLFTFLVLSLFSVSANTGSDKNARKFGTHKWGGHKPGKAVGAPLDGGLLIALGAAGVAYFSSRKKKQNPGA